METDPKSQAEATKPTPAAVDTSNSGTIVAEEESLEPTEPDASSGFSEANQAAATTPTADNKPSKKRGIFAKFNIYLLLFIFILLVAGMALFIGIQQSRKAATPTEITSQTLSTDAVNQLKGNDVKIGDVKQTLNVESNAVFAGKILVQGTADIAGSVKAAGVLSATTINASGTGSFDKLQSNDLAIAGNAGVLGQFTVQKTLNVSGGASFGGAVSIPQLTVDTITLNGNLVFNGHIDAGGNTPSKVNGTALGSGGTASISGTDTAGNVVINTGSGPASGCFLTISFVKKFNGTPHVVVSPVSSDTAGLAYYVNRNTATFSICATNPAASKNYSFDFVVID